MTPDPTLIEQEVLGLFRAFVLGVQSRAASGWSDDDVDHAVDAFRAGLRETLEATLQGSAALPIPMLLYCPQCGQAHVDEPDERTPDWTNPPHRSHLCHDCGCIWRPADVPTTGVTAIETQGKADTWTAERGNAESAMRATTPTALPTRGAVNVLLSSTGEAGASNNLSTPTAPIQDTGASVPDQALAVPVERFWQKVDKSGECWLWTAALDRYGYGTFWLNGKCQRAHRVSFANAGNYLIPGFVIDHLCRNRRCVNPAHLRQISNRQNLLESPQAAAGKGVAKTHCKRGHPLSGSNLRRNSSGTRRCKACDAAWLREYRAQ